MIGLATKISFDTAMTLTADTVLLHLEDAERRDETTSDLSLVQLSA